MTDYVYTANDTDPHTLLAQGLYRIRPQTVLLPPDPSKPANLKQFIRNLSYSTDVNLPIGNLILASHGAKNGWLALSLDGTTDDAGVATEVITFEVLETARNERKIVIPASVLPSTTDGGISPVYFHVRGCEIGKSPQFVDLLQSALGGLVHVTAPKYWHGFGKFPDRDQPLFWFEYLAYEFGQYYPYQDKKPHYGGLPNRTKLINDLKNNSNHLLIDGTRVPDKLWDKWLPKPLPAGNDTGEKPHPITLSLNPQWQVKPNVFTADLLVSVFEEDLPVMETVQDGPAANSPAAERRVFMKQVLGKKDKYKDNYRLLPMYKRYGFNTLDDFMNAFNWVREDPEGDLWIAKRYYYGLRVPVTVPNTNQLICNLYPATGSTPFLGMLELDNRLFYTKMATVP